MSQNKNFKSKGASKHEEKNTYVNDTNNECTGKGSGGKRFSKGSSDAGTGRAGGRSGSGSNHLGWYVSSDEIANAAGAISFGDAIGGESNYDILGPSSVPGIAVFNWAPNYGMGSQTQRDFKIAANKIYADTRKANSRTATYQPVDEMLYFLAMDNIFIFYSMLVRVYGHINNYSVLNRYKARALVEALGFDFNSISDNLANFRFKILQFVNQLAHLPVPNLMPMIEKHAWMSMNVWQETKSEKTQYYAFVPSVIYKLDKTAVETGGALVPVWTNLMGGGPGERILLTIEDVDRICSQLVTSVAYDDDIINIVGDILKAFGDKGFTYLSEIPENWTLNPIVIENDSNAYEVLVGVHNANIFPVSEFGLVEQSAGNFLRQNFSCDYGLISDGAGGARYGDLCSGQFAIWSNETDDNDRFIDLIHPDATTANIMYATRYMAGTVARSDWKYTSIDFGTEFFTSIDITYAVDTDGSGKFIRMGQAIYLGDIEYSWREASSTQQFKVADAYKVLSAISAFKYLPMFFIIGYNDMSDFGYDVTQMAARLQDLNTCVFWTQEFTTRLASSDPIDKLHSVARITALGFAK